MEWITKRHQDEAKQQSGERQASARLGDSAPQMVSRFDPLSDNDLDVRQSFLVRLAVCGAARQLRYFRDERLVGLAPINNDFVFSHRRGPQNLPGKLVRAPH